MKPGIERISITSELNGRGAWRFKVAEPCHGFINQTYRSLFNLLPGLEYVKCTPEEKFARYDIEFGVDVILNFTNGQRATIQEKVLTTQFSTVTVEYYQDWRNEIPGDWFNLMCDFYFVGYTNSRPNELDRWILLDWNKVKMAGDIIRWQARENQGDGAMANFRYVHFDAFPPDCVVAKYLNGGLSKRAIPQGSPQQPLF